MQASLPPSSICDRQHNTVSLPNLQHPHRWQYVRDGRCVCPQLSGNLTWMGTMPAFFEMLMPVSPPVKLMQFTAGCVCMERRDV